MLKDEVLNATEITNLYPYIANVSFGSKIIEKIAAAQFIHYRPYGHKWPSVNLPIEIP